MKADHSSRTATIDWDEHGQPISSRFDDVYFSKANGLEETRYVFLAQNHLTERWQALPADTGGQFAIGETGFGTGLNFLAAWELWRRLAPETWQLHFVSTEKFPLTYRDLSRALRLWPELKALSGLLLNAYPPATTEGFHRLVFDAGRVVLTLIVEDAAAGFSQLLTCGHPLFERPAKGVQAWFLDGFAPAKNPDMWSDALFAAIGKLSDTGATAATFTAAGVVKHGLRAAGFRVEKVAGFGHKRDMIRAVLDNPTCENPANFTKGAFCSPYDVPWPAIANPAATTEKSALIIGGGLAGCHTAHALARRGWRVTLLERGGELASGGSGNPQGVLYAKLSPKHEALGEFNLASLLYAQRFYAPLWLAEASNQRGQQCGVLQLSYSAGVAGLHRALAHRFRYFPGFVQFLDADGCRRVSGVATPHEGLFFPAAGWLAPAEVCAELTRHNHIRVVTGAGAEALAHEDGQWNVCDSLGRTLARAPVAVVANAWEARQFEQTRYLPLQTIRGQVSFLPAGDYSRRLCTVLCGEGYIAPASGDSHCIGATFGIRDSEPELRPEEHLANLENLGVASPELALHFHDVNSEQLGGRVAFRCATPDYLPAVGPVPDQDAFLTDYALLRKNAKASIPVAGQYLPGLYVNVGHGSRGLAYTPLCAELLAGYIQAELPPLPRTLTAALHPARFIIRGLVRNQILA